MNVVASYGSSHGEVAIGQCILMRGLKGSGSSQSETRGLVVFHSRPLSMDIKSISNGDLFPHPRPVR